MASELVMLNCGDARFAVVAWLLIGAWAVNNLPYTIWRGLQPADRTYEGSGDQYVVGVKALAKHHPTNPFEVANEMIALRLGVAMGLPVPVGCPLQSDGKQFYGSLHVSAADHQLTGVTLDDIKSILDERRLACGIILFDSWILNEDRTDDNLLYDFDAKRVYLIDHGRSPFTGQRDGTEKNRDSIGIGLHCLRDIGSFEWFEYWHSRMIQIPRDYIRESVDIACTVGLPQQECDYLTTYLLERRERLPAIFLRDHKLIFSKVDNSLFNPFFEPFVHDYSI